MEEPLLLLVDGHSLAFRSYYAFAYRGEGGLRSSTGVPTSVCFGFLKALLEILARETPSAIAIAFDLGLPTFRHEADSTYKAGRAETPAEFVPDLENLRRILAALPIATVTKPGFEADDLIGTLALQAKADGYRVKIVSGDQDLFQLIDAEQYISVLHLGQKDKIQEFSSAEVMAKLGVSPNQVVDYKALCGDSSDNIPGVRGIGAKTAVKLLAEYGSLEQVLGNIPQMKGAIALKLKAGIDSAQHSQFLAKIKTDVELDLSLADCHWQGFELTRVTPLLQTLELKEIINKLRQFALPTEAPTLESDAEELWFDFSPQPFDLRVQIIDQVQQLVDLVHLLQQADLVAWDTETTSLNPFEAQLVGIGCAWGEGLDQVAYIPIGHKSGQNLDLDSARSLLQPLLADPTQSKVLQNTKFDRLILRAQGMELAGVVFDPMLASYVLDPEAGHGLSSLCLKYFGFEPLSYEQLVPKKQTIADLEIAQVARYCGMDAYTSWRLVPILRSRLDQIPELAQVFEQIELPLEIVLAEMEWRGIRIDRGYLAQFAQELDRELNAITCQAHTQAGKEFNLSSPKQLGEILLELLGEQFSQKSRKSKLGYSTDVAVLQKLQGTHPLIDTILCHRTLAKLKSTYVDALPTLIQPQTQRVHTDFNQTVTATGRLSSSHPNLQNIPIRTAFSRQIRRAFLPAEGWILVTADYSQIELRILAHLSQEPELVNAYNQNLDVHTRTAQLILGKEQVTNEERRLAKIINYGVIYGMGAQKFSRETGISVGEAKDFIQAFYQQYARIFSYMQEVEERAIADGYVTTVSGRRRYFPDLAKATGQYRAGMLRSAVNAPIQGTSADIIKLAMIKLAQLLQEYEAKILLQVHDELVFEMPSQELEPLLAQIKTTMENALPLAVPLVVDLHQGQNWMEAK
ncbi:MAG: DNA polymerase I [Pseudanabaenaceae cyanobacterium bins.68]|nr:DNA polymerase I [Pseudanabaenaceae cyanobacterium bins.68]